MESHERKEWFAESCMQQAWFDDVDQAVYWVFGIVDQTKAKVGDPDLGPDKYNFDATDEEVKKRLLARNKVFVYETMGDKFGTHAHIVHRDRYDEHLATIAKRMVKRR